MRLTPGFLSSFLLIVLGLVASTGAKEIPVPTIWYLSDITRIGGHSPVLLGQPQLITESDGKSLRFDGIADGLLLPVNPLESFSGFTIEVLMKAEAGGLEAQRFLHIEDELGSRALFETRLVGQNWALDTFLKSLKTQSHLTLLDRTKLHPVDHWTWVALVYANGRMAHYVNGVKELEGAVDFPPTLAGKISLGVRQNQVFWFKGALREVRFHSRPLVAEELQRAQSGQ